MVAESGLSSSALQNDLKHLFLLVTFSQKFHFGVCTLECVCIFNALTLTEQFSVEQFSRLSFLFSRKF